jgi:SPX domain protein involved in polyphosphate accumulation
MKFAKILQEELVPEWRKKYIDYKGLKRLLKSIQQEALQTCESLDTDGPAEVSITIPQPTASVQQQEQNPTIVKRMSRRLSNAMHKRPSFISTSQSTFLFVV